MDHENKQNCETRQESTGSRVAAGLLLTGRFRLVRPLGHGGLGEIWLAEDTALDGELVACKLLRDDVREDARAVSELKREVLMTRRLRHPNILGVYTIWDTTGEPFITMEYVPGNDLGEALNDRTRPFSPTEVQAWFQQLAGALDYAHSQGVLHRDVKPGNILLDEYDAVRLSDFGIARMAREVRARSGAEPTAGTVLYMSPEQIAGQDVGPWSDQYSLAVTIYELLSGSPPFHEGSVVSQIQLRTPDAIGGIHPAINAVLLQALSKDTTTRFPTCQAFYENFSGAMKAYPETPGGVATAGARIHSPGYEAETTVLPPQGTTTLYLRLGMILIEDGVISQDELDTALAEQQQSGGRIGRILVQLGFADAPGIARGLARQLHVPFSDLADQQPDAGMLARLPGSYARDRGCLPLRREQGLAVVAMADPLDIATLNDLEARLGARLGMVIATEEAIRACLARAR